MKTYVLYPGNCYDGFGAAFAAWLRLGDDAIYIPVNYGQPVPEIEAGSIVYIVDFSYPYSDLIGLADRVSKLVVLDHHQTAEKDLSGMVFPENTLIQFNMAKSGAVLCCEHFHGDSLKCEVGQIGEFFAYLQDRDLWQFKLPLSREVSMALRSYPFDFRQWSEISGIVVQGQIYEMPGICIDNLKKEGVACRRLTEQQVEIMAKNHRWGYFDTKSGKVEIKKEFDPGGNGEPTLPVHIIIMPVANATVFFSEVGEKLLELNPAMDCAGYYLDRKDGNRQWGLRSRETFDSSAVAKAFGGGGHKCASGFVQKI